MSKHCEDCGNNPSPHWLLYVAQTTVYLISTLPRFMFKKTNRQFKKVVDWIAEKTHIMYWSDDIEPDSERTKVVVAAAKKTGVRIQQQKVFGKRDDMLRFEQNGTWHEFFSLPSSIQDGEKTRTLLDSKWHTKQFLESFDAATPKGFVVHTSRQLNKALRRLSYPAVIKPAQGSRGRHSHILINDQEQAVSAFKSAKKICAFVMCEEMLHGSVYRFTTVNGKVVAVLRGDYPSVIGDGQHTVRQLLAKKNAKRAAQISEVKITKSLRGLLEKQSTKLDSIPEKGEQVLLGQKIGVRYGGDAVEVTSHTHPTFTAGLERVAEKIPLFILGFDVIAEDITKPDIEQKWGIIEINTVPFINLHHYPRSGKPVDVASIVWREIRRQFQE